MKRILVSLLLAAGLITLPVASHAEAGFCYVRNVNTGFGASVGLQMVIDRATAGDTITVEGTCIGNFVIDKSLRLEGVSRTDAPRPTLDGQLQGRVLHVVSNAAVHLVNLQITHGFLDGMDGGGILNEGGTLTLGRGTNVIANGAGRGGGVFNLDGTINLRADSTVAENTSSSDGAGVFSQHGAINLFGSSMIRRNVTFGAGGGIAGVLAQFLITDDACVCRNRSKTPDNLSQRGAGINFYQSDLTITGNGAVRGNFAMIGGGIWQKGGTVTLADAATVSGNRATRFGGGIYIEDGELLVMGSAVVGGNSAELRGGGIFSGGTIIFSGTAQLRANTARIGGGLYNDGTAVFEDHSLVTENVATHSSAGGIFNGGTVTLLDEAMVVGNLPEDCVSC